MPLPHITKRVGIFLLQNAATLITKCVSNFITKRCYPYYKMRQLLQNAATPYYKTRKLLQNASLLQNAAVQ